MPATVVLRIFAGHLAAYRNINASGIFQSSCRQQNQLLCKLNMTTLNVKRVYEDAEEQDGTRILVDRLWPRGLTKDKAKIDRWMKEVAPSTQLRQWYNHEPEKWDEFKALYFKELAGDGEVHVRELCSHVKKGTVTLLFGSKEPKLNNAYALKEYIEHQCWKKCITSA